LDTLAATEDSPPTEMVALDAAEGSPLTGTSPSTRVKESA
jgi:hypothetical protein